MSTVKKFQPADRQLTNRSRLLPTTGRRVPDEDDEYIMTLERGNRKITVYNSDQLECFKHFFDEGYVLHLTERPKDKSA